MHQQLSQQQIETVVANLTRYTPRSDAYKHGVRQALTLRFNNERNTTCPWRPGSVEFDAYCAGRDAGDVVWRVEQIEQVAA